MQSYSGPYFLAFGLNTDQNNSEYGHFLRSANTAVTGITETKLDNTVYDSEVAVEGYNIVRNNRNRNSGSVACYIRSNICYNGKACISNNIENFFIDLLFPKTKPISVVIIYKPPSQS